MSVQRTTPGQSDNRFCCGIIVVLVVVTMAAQRLGCAWAQSNAPGERSSATARVGGQDLVADVGDEGLLVGAPLEAGGYSQSVILAETEEDAGAYSKANVAHDDYGMQDLLSSGRITIVRTGTIRARLIDANWTGLIKVRLLTGDRTGDAVWTFRECLVRPTNPPDRPAASSSDAHSDAAATPSLDTAASAAAIHLRHRFNERQRYLICRALWAAEVRGDHEAQARVRLGPSPSLAVINRQVELSERLQERRRAAVRREHHLSEEEASAIEDEGVQKLWKDEVNAPAR